MEMNQKPGISKEIKQKAEIQKKDQLSPTKCFSQIAYLETERILKTAEVKSRVKFYKFLKTTREEIVHDYPAANSVYLRHLEEYQIGEAAKRCEEVKAIKKEMRSIDERAKKIWSTK